MGKLLSPSELYVFECMQVDTASTLERRYGRESKFPKLYHNKDHAVHVTTAVAIMNKAANTPYWERLLMATGAMKHDFIHHFGIGCDWDERLSAMAARLAMRETELFDVYDEEFVEEIMIGTNVTLDGPHIYQRAADLGIAARRLADGDLYAFGMPPKIYRPIAEALHYERNPDVPLVGETLARFATSQVAFLKAHEFFTREARQSFPHKQENIDYMTYVARTAA